MAKKTFSDLKGSILEVEYDGKKSEVHSLRDYHTLIGIKYIGDIFYWLDKDNNFELKQGVIKENWQYSYGGSSMSYSLDVEGTNGYINCGLRQRNIERNTAAVFNMIKHFSYKGRRSHYGLFFTTEEEALEWQAKLREGKMFAGLKKGDKIYCVSDIYTEEPHEATLIEIKNHNGNADEYELDFGEDGVVFIGTSIYEDRTNEQLDAFFYTYMAKLGHYVKLFLNRDDAVKFIAEYKKRKKKSATDKYIKQIENHDGKPIEHKDNLGNELHYGDTVAYIRRTGCNSHPEIRTGVIVGESKTKITVLDKDEKEKGIPVGWGDGTKQTDGKHSVENQSIMLISVAEVNKKSNFTFTK